MRKLKALCASLLLTFSLAACPSLPTIADPMARLYATNESVKATCIDMLVRQRLSSAEGQDCLEYTDQATALITAYRATRTYDALDLQTVNQLLRDLERRLAEEQAR